MTINTSALGHLTLDGRRRLIRQKPNPTAGTQTMSLSRLQRPTRESSVTGLE